MSRPTLITPDTPLWLKVLLYPYQFAASLGLAVILISSAAVMFGLGTIIEAIYGTPSAQFFVYQTWWFNVLMALLAINIFSAAAIRFPWKKHQTGFVVTHIGLLTLIFGMSLGRTGGIDAQMPVFEYSSEHWAYDQDAYFELAISPNREDATEEDMVVVRRPFHPSPFNWQDYKLPISLFTMTNRAAAGDVFYEHDGVKLETLDFYSDSEIVPAPMLELRVSMPQNIPMMQGRKNKGPLRWQPVRLAVAPAKDKETFPYGIPSTQRVGGGTMMLSIAANKAQQECFLKSTPKGPLGEKGQVVLYVKGKFTRFQVDEKLGAGRFALNGSELEAELVSHWDKVSPGIDPATGRVRLEPDETATGPAAPTVVIKLYRGDREVGQLSLLAATPELNMFDYENQVFGDYWFDYSKLTMQEREQLGVTSRIEFLQGADEQTFYYRYWNRKDIVNADTIPLHGDEDHTVNAFKMPADQLRMYVERYATSSEPVLDKVLPKKFDRAPMVRLNPAVKVRLTVDDTSDVFWLRQHLGSPEEPPSRDAQKIVRSKKRTVSVTMPYEAVDIGFRVKLVDFERKLDPGTSQASHFSSTVDFLDLHRDRKIRSVGLNGGAVTDLTMPEEVTNPTGLAVDAVGGQLFWTDPKQRVIQRAGIEDDKPKTIVTGGTFSSPGLNEPGPIVIDPVAKHLYWSDMVPSAGTEFGVVRRATFDGVPLSGKSPMGPQSPINKGYKHEAIVAVEGRITAIAVDPQSKKIYWHHRRNGGIGRANLDGSDVEPDFVPAIGAVNALAVDPQGGRIYWTDAEERQIRSASLKDGSDESLVLSRANDEMMPESLAIDHVNGYIYFTERDLRPRVSTQGSSGPEKRRDAVVRCTLEGADIEPIATDAIDDPQAITIDSETSNTVYWTQSSAFRTDVWITMNAPVDIVDPNSGKSYRLFQESLNGPFKPGSAMYERNIPDDAPAEELYSSTLTVNHDPGRGFRGAGCLLVVAGIGLMFYMKAYFFTGGKARSTEPASSPKKVSTQEILREAAISGAAVSTALPRSDAAEKLMKRKKPAK